MPDAVVAQRLITGGGVIARRVLVKRTAPECAIEIAGNIEIKRKSTGGRVTVAICVGRQRIITGGCVGGTTVVF